MLTGAKNYQALITIVVIRTISTMLHADEALAGASRCGSVATWSLSPSLLGCLSVDQPYEADSPSNDTIPRRL